ncbi:MAG: biotin transporter BioY [Eubacteriales bacterium]|nr:biotin transporter BioY [Eubacteriales bacterium]
MSDVKASGASGASTASTASETSKTSRAAAAQAAFTTRDLTLAAVMTAAMCALCPFSIPIGPIPVSLQILIMLLTAYLLPARLAALASAAYILLGAAGLPVFSGFQGGLAKLAGPTGGYIIGFLFMVILSSSIIEKTGHKAVPAFIAALIGVVLDYAFGTFWFVLQMKCGLWYALTVCVFPFAALDAAKAAAAVIFGKAVRTALTKAGLL